MARAAADSGGDGSGYDYDYDYDRDRDNKEDNVYTEFRFPMSSDTSKSSASVGPVARGVGKSAGISTDRGENLDDPDILKDLGKPGVGRGDDFAWQRSASCKELGMLYRQERLLKTDAAGGGGVSGSDFQRGDQASKFDSFRYCYSCHGQTPCFDRNGGRAGGGGGSGGVGSAHDQSEMKVYSSSYPGTGSTPHTSLESGDEEPVPPANVFIMDDDDDHHAGVTVTVEDEDEDDDNEGDEDYKKISQDDLSHDSYEVLEKEEEERVFGSRSSSVESDEMFIMENDYRSVSKHILWREGSDDVEKRLGYVEPRYRNIGFNEFNEICKRGFAARNRDTSQSHGNIKFSEFGTKGDHAGVGAGPGAPFESTRSSVISAIIGGHDMVSRTKSDPYMLKQKSSNKQKLYGLHQKSFELPPTEFNDVVEDDRFATSKSTVDIPYTLRIRNAMNGTARNADEASMYETNSAASAASASRSKSEVDLGSASSSAAACVRIGGGVEDSKRSDHGASQDSGLSLSLGTESVLDDTDIDFKNILMTKNNYEQVVTTKKSTKLMLSLSEENNENVAGHESSSTKAAEGDVVVVVAAAGKTSPRTESPQQPSVKSTSTGGGGGGGAGDKKERKSKSTLSADDIVVEKHITKVKSVECPRAKVHAAAAKIRKSRSAEAAYERKGSFLRTESSSGGGGSRGKKEIIVIDSDDYHSFDDSRSDKRSDGSDSVIIVEYRGNRRKKLSKKASSDSRGSQAESEASSFDAPRMKKKDLKKRNSTQGYFSKDRIPTIEISEDETYKAAAGGVDQAGAALVAIRRRCPQQQQYEYSSDERHASGSDLSKTEIINESQEEIKSPTSAATGGVVSPMTEDEVEKDLLIADGTNKIDKAQETPPPSTIAIAESAPQQPPAPPPPQFDKKDQKPPVPKKLKSLVAVAAAAAAVVTTANKTEIRNKEPVSSASKKLVGGEKSPILTRLGLSEGSATAQLNQQKLSPSAARRAKSLDTPIVSLHRLPPITSFSSKDDTVDNEEGVVLEEKTIKQVKSKLEPVSETTPIDTLPSAEPDLLRSSDQVVPNTKTAETNEESTSTTTTTTTTDTTVVQQPIDCGAADTCGPPPEPSRLRLSKELKRNSIAAVTMFKQSLDMKSAKKMESETLALSKERSKSEGYEKSLASSGCQTPERKHSTRQERLDSFKKLKNFSIELWESEDVDAAAAAAVAAAAAAAAKAKKFNTSTSKEYDDSVFDEELKSPRSPKPSSIPVVATASACEMPDKELPPLPADAIDDQSTSATESAGRPSTTSYTSDATAEDDTPEPPARVTSAAGAVATTAAATVAVAEAEAVTDTGAAAASVETPTGERKSLKLNLEGLFTPQQIQEMEIIQGLLNASPTTAESKAIPDKRSFDDEPSSSSSMQPDPLKPYPLESSGSSSVEEAILPPDYVDDEELPDVTNLNVMLDSADFLAGKSSATLTTSSFGSAGAFFSLSRTLSRISERSTTSEQERTTDMDEDSTKPLSRSLSIDDSIISSDQQPSFSSDPPSGMNLDHVFDEDDAAAAVAELDDDKLDFNIPPPLLSGDEEWPSPPHSAGSVKTPVIDNERYSAVAVPAALSAACSAISADADADADADAGAKKSEDDDSTTEDNKTLHDEEVEVEVISDHEEKMAFTKELQRPRGSVGDDTSAGITTSDWSSSTGTTIKQAHGFATYSKSEDNSLAGDYGVLSISTDTCVASESRKSSTDDLAPIPLEKKYLTLDRKQTSFERRQIFFPATFPSFEDEYDSPYTESEDTPSSPIPSHVLRKPPPPPRHFQTPAPALAPSLQQQQQQQPQPQPGPSSAAVVSSTAELAAGAVAMSVSPNSSAATAQKLMRTKCERNRAAKFLPHYTSSSMSTSLESPTSAERKFAKSVAKAKCYSYYSLARSPPSDGSSSSPEAPETPLTPNTIPRVSKRRRNPHTMRRRQQRAESHAKAFDYSTSPSSAHTPHTPKQFHYPPRRSRH
ncbi:uncharacterized protein LOC135839884 [Planococcus citri]|uniref:uncharacterized protein LOC135839884 n=1 Tax=Planococcus citri TaxID=170843 RepID=UPI0031F9BAE0